MLVDESGLEVRNGRRDHISIISDILLCAMKGVSKTQLMYKAGLSHTQLDKYMRRLVTSELLETSNGGRRPVYKTTSKGKTFLETFDELVKLLN